MKQVSFDLKKALSGDYVISTKDGRDVDYVNYTGLKIDFPIMAHIVGENDLESYSLNGKYSHIKSSNDLVLTKINQPK